MFGYCPTFIGSDGLVGEKEEVVVVESKRLKGKRYAEQANAQEKLKKGTKPTAQRKSQAASKPAGSKATPRNGMIVEVVLPARSKTSSTAAPSSPASTSAAEEESKALRPKRRLTKRRVTNFSDDDDGAASGTSEFVPEEQALSSDNDLSHRINEMEVDDSEAESVPAKSAKANGKAKASAKSSRSSVITDSEDAMDLDDEPKGKAKTKTKAKAKASKKRKNADSEDEDKAKTKPPAKKPRRDEQDPWKLASPGVKRDWTEMKAPPLEMFYFARTVVDEYTYLEGKVHSMVTHLTAARQWVLSGTPPLSDFSALKTIAAFLNVHLGIDDDGEGDSAKKRRKEQTGRCSNALFAHTC